MALICSKALVPVDVTPPISYIYIFSCFTSLLNMLLNFFLYCISCSEGGFLRYFDGFTTAMDDVFHVLFHSSFNAGVRREDNGLAANRQDGVWQRHFMGRADITIFLLMSPDLFRCARLWSACRGG